jgi:hypothetical protein
MMDASQLWPGILQFWGSDGDQNWRDLYGLTNSYRFTKAERRRLKRLRRRHDKLERKLDRNQAKQDRLCERAKARQAEGRPPMPSPPRFADEAGALGFIIKRDPDNPPNPDFSHLNPPPMGLA